MAKLARPTAKIDKAKAANVIKEPALLRATRRPSAVDAVWLCFDALACGGGCLVCGFFNRIPVNRIAVNRIARFGGWSL